MGDTSIGEFIGALLLIVLLMTGLSALGITSGFVDDPILREVVTLAVALGITFIIFIMYQKVSH
jgi:Ca2+/Na+ antiporter